MIFKQGRGRFGAGIAIVLAALAAVVATGSVVAPSPAKGDAFGQLSSWGEYGTGAAQLNHATGFALDRTDGSSYVVDGANGVQAYRLRKFSAAGSPLGMVNLPWELVGGKPKVVGGIAVDHSTDPGRVYVLRYQYEEVAEAQLALEINVFSTAPNLSGELVEAAPSITLPTDADAIYNPGGVALDPATKDLVVAGNAADGKVVVQVIHPDGSLGTRWIDATGEFKSAALPERESEPWGLAVADGGKVFLAAPQASDVEGAHVFTLPAGFTSGSSATLLPLSLTASSTVPAEVTRSYGSQLAVSPDGNILYYTSVLAFETGGTPGNYLVHGYSVADQRDSAVYGGGVGAGCKVLSKGPALAGAGNDGRVFVLDHGDLAATPQTYGAKVLEFGPAGSGCPFPFTAVKVNGSKEPPAAAKGAPVSLEAASDELHGANPTKVTWTVTGPESFTESTAGSPAPLSITHRFGKVGTYTIELELETDSALGDPPPVTKALSVQAVPPQALFLASTASPAPGEVVTFDAGESVDPAGSPTAEPTFQLANYHWDFGDGSAAVDTTAPTITHAFANPGSGAIARTVTLTVTSAEGLTGSVAQTLSVRGTPGSGGGGGGGTGTTPPPTCATNPALCPKPAPRPKPKPLVCKKGFKKKTVKGKAKCVKVKKHKATKKH